MSDFYTSTARKAAKPHRCEMCRGTIPAGVMYLDIRGSWQGDFYAIKAHEDCQAMWNEMHPHHSDVTGCMEHDLGEVLLNMGAMDARPELDAYRGHYPHVVARLEFRFRRWFEEDAA